MKKLVKFGKKSSDISIIKNFLSNNKKLFSWQKKLFEIYKKEPLRKFCKNCGNKIKKKIFIKIKIPYILCKNCGHLNGGYSDTLSLAKKFYQNSKGKDYSKFYISNKKNRSDYNLRIKNIYLPKVEFLFKSLKQNEKKFHFIDVGCGAGHYIAALKKRGIKDLNGYDPSLSMTTYGNKLNKFDKLKYIDMEKVNNFIKHLSSEKPIILSMIGTFEHIYNNIEVLKSIKKNKQIKYFYISVPCFSLSSFIELAFDNFYQRLSAPQHTHFYTEKSLKYIENKFKIKIISEWWFGVDILDLMRSFKLNFLNGKKIRNDGIKIYDKMFSNKVVDELQKVIDRNKLSAEVHIVFKVN